MQTTGERGDDSAMKRRASKGDGDECSRKVEGMRDVESTGKGDRERR